MKNICGHDPSHLRCENRASWIFPDALHRANFRGSFGAIFIFTICLSFAGCSSRVVYEVQISVAAEQSVLNINTATAEELDQLPYIGRKTAEKIIQFREENGPFRRVEHVMQIRGISEKRFNEIRSFLKAE
jgi:competence ComEA-like helix-hairpin-helix protein